MEGCISGRQKEAVLPDLPTWGPGANVLRDCSSCCVPLLWSPLRSRGNGPAQWNGSPFPFLNPDALFESPRVCFHFLPSRAAILDPSAHRVGRERWQPAPRLVPVSSRAGPHALRKRIRGPMAVRSCGYWWSLSSEKIIPNFPHPFSTTQAFISTLILKIYILTCEYSLKEKIQKETPRVTYSWTTTNQILKKIPAMIQWKWLQLPTSLCNDSLREPHISCHCLSGA